MNGRGEEREKERMNTAITSSQEPHTQTQVHDSRAHGSQESATVALRSKPCRAGIKAAKIAVEAHTPLTLFYVTVRRREVDHPPYAWFSLSNVPIHCLLVEEESTKSRVSCDLIRMKRNRNRTLSVPGSRVLSKNEMYPRDAALRNQCLPLDRPAA